MPHNAEKTERGDPLRLFNIHSVAEHQKIEGGLLVSPDIVCYAEKQTFLVQFATPKISICHHKIS